MFGFIKNALGINSPDLQSFQDRDAVVIDVRSPQEFQSGHVKGSINIPLPALANNLVKIQQFNKPVITCCASGMRSGAAARQLSQAGIESVNGGAWTAVVGKMQ